jgi:hypothetical protein
VKVRRGRPPRLSLEPVEAEVIRRAAEELLQLLAADAAGPSTADSDDPLAAIVGPIDTGEPVDDAVLRRLLPDAYRDDEESAAEWRRLGRSEVRSAMTEAVRRLLDDLPPGGRVVVRLDDEHVEYWLTALTDLRLALGTRLEITDDRWYDAALRLPEDDPRRMAYAFYEFLTACQSVILDAVG